MNFVHSGLRVIHFLFTLLLFSGVSAVVAQEASGQKKYSYTTVPGDPLKARIYTLENGLTVYMSVYKNTPVIATRIAVKAGSKNDPHDATGLAHYLEHMLFKGTDQFGSLDYSKEKPLLDTIQQLFEYYRTLKDTLQRKQVYHVIDSLSGVASHYAIANEYDKLSSGIGATGTNAYTSVEQTVYVNEIPSNQLGNWLTTEAERFRNPVMRLFHTELEAVYEEKNRNLDSDGSRLWEALYAAIYKKHPYGTQTTIGSIEHLKNPSLKKIMEYYHTYYVPNNVAICLSGDFDPDKAIRMIDEKFGQWKPGKTPVFTYEKEDSITKPVSIQVVGPDAETMAIAFRFDGGAGSPDADMLNLLSQLLYNNKTGLVDRNINQAQKALGANSFPDINKDYSLHLFMADPKEGQRLEDLTTLLLAQLDSIKKGAFSEELLGAIITNLKLDETRLYENNSIRASAFAHTFTTGVAWDRQVHEMERLSKITKKDVVDFVNKNYRDNYVVVYKRTGIDTTILKVKKPQITPVAMNRDTQSVFVKTVLGNKPAPIEPVFLDYKKDLEQLKIKNKIPLLYKMNTENNLFDLYYVFEMGSHNDRKIPIALRYLNYLGTATYTPEKLKEEFYRLGCSYTVYSSGNGDRMYINLSGLNDNFEPALKLLEHLLSDLQPNKEILDNLVGDIVKERADAKLSRSTILWSAMNNYGKYGPKSPFTYILSEKELRALKPGELTQFVKGLASYEHRVLYYGPGDTSKITASLNALHQVSAQLKPVPAPAEFVQLATTANTVYVVHYPDMQQAEVLMVSKKDNYDATLAPVISLFNEYYGGSMASVVFQEMRESKALAYSVFADFTTPSRLNRAHYVQAYIGTQADKLPEAMEGMSGLLNTFSESAILFSASKESVLQRIRTNRIIKADILFDYLAASTLNLDHDLRKDVFEKTPGLSLADIKAFHEKQIKNSHYTILVLGEKSKLNPAVLKKYGEVKTLSLNEIFGY